MVEERLLEPWFQWKQELQDDTGFSFGLDYTPLYLKSNADGFSGEDKAASGILRVFGAWDLTGRGTLNTGALVWKIEHRHSYTDVSPQGFGFDQGYIGLIEPPWSDEGTRLTNLYWRQRLAGGKATIVAGHARCHGLCGCVRNGESVDRLFQLCLQYRQCGDVCAE